MRTPSELLCAALTLSLLACDQTAAPPTTGAPAPGSATAAGAQPATGAPAATAQPAAATAPTAQPSLPADATQPVAAAAWAEPSGEFTVGFSDQPTLTEKKVTTPAGTINMKMYMAPKGEARLGVNFGPLTLPSGQSL